MSGDMTQAEADALIRMEKVRADSVTYRWPGAGGHLQVPLLSRDRTERFLLDVNQSGIRVSKVTFQNRVRTVIILVRLDLDSPPHTNPDGELIPSLHIHLYREGYGDRWAIALDPAAFKALDNPWLTLQDFMTFCNITEAPNLEPRSVP